MFAGDNRRLMVPVVFFGATVFFVRPRGMENSPSPLPVRGGKVEFLLSGGNDFIASCLGAASVIDERGEHPLNGRRGCCALHGCGLCVEMSSAGRASLCRPILAATAGLCGRVANG